MHPVELKPRCLWSFRTQSLGHIVQDLAAAQPAQAAEHLARAVAENGDFAAVQTRTRFDLARALIQQRAGYAQGIAEMADVQRRAGKLGMVNLAAQAAAELDRSPGDER